MFYFPNLDETTRLNMITELERDCKQGLFYEPVSMQKAYIPIYKTLLLKTFASGSVEMLQNSLLQSFFREKDLNGRKTPTNIAQVVAFSDFNRYYSRAILIRALDEGKSVSIYRAKTSQNERKESNAILFRSYSSKSTLEQFLKTMRDYRLLFSKNSKVDFMKPNSGLSLRLL